MVSSARPPRQEGLPPGRTRAWNRTRRRAAAAAGWGAGRKGHFAPRTSAPRRSASSTSSRTSASPPQRSPTCGWLRLCPNGRRSSLAAAYTSVSSAALFPLHLKGFRKKLLRSAQPLALSGGVPTILPASGADPAGRGAIRAAGHAACRLAHTGQQPVARVQPVVQRQRNALPHLPARLLRRCGVH